MRALFYPAWQQLAVKELPLIDAAGSELMTFECRSGAEVIKTDADAILVQWAPITGSVINQLSRNKVIVRYGIGVDNVGLDAARKRGITVQRAGLLHR